ncbi:hypothetical protein [Hwanghaeella sp. 1Z406]|uniref:hypothetical protein n=1 Tax=Hwanghaeella sp. 1Z406 TaxID=3402811 RepID=UPI003B66E606
MAERDVSAIASEDDLWDLLESLMDGSVSGRARVYLDGWSPEILYFPDEPTGHTISPAAAKAVTDLHKSLSRSYAFLAYGTNNAGLLRIDDKKLLDIRFVVTDGSSGLDLEDYVLEAILSGLTEKMTGAQITITIVLFLVLYFSQSFARHWVNSVYEQKRHDRSAGERVQLSEQETRRAEILANALREHPNLAPMQDYSDDARRSLISAARAYPRSRVLGADLTAEEARIILSSDREQGVGRRIDGRFEVARINTEVDDGHLFRLKATDSSVEIDAQATRIDLPQEDIHLLFQAAESKENVSVLINAWVVGERIVKATVVRVEKVNGGENDDT